MSWNFDEIERGAVSEIEGAQTPQALEAIRVKYLGRKGLVSEIYSSLPTLSAEEKPLIGKKANILKNRLTELLEEKQKALGAVGRGSAQSAIDVTIPGVRKEAGHLHILTQTTNDICAIFEKLGSTVLEGPEVETEFNNFTALNIPIDHPSRDAFDTFYLDLEDPKAKGR